MRSYKHLLKAGLEEMVKARIFISGKFFSLSMFCQFAFVQDQDIIRPFNCPQPVSDNDRCAVAQEFVYGAFYQLLRSRI
jgi:hypothetical protein